MYKIYPALIFIGLLAVAGWLVWGSINPDARPALGGATSTAAATETAPKEVPVTHECNADGKVCSDGSVVGRTGPLCEFAACPTPERTSTLVRTTMGQEKTGLGVSITPRAVVDDSRCPTDVQCVWAGKAHVKATVHTIDGTSDVTFELGHSETLGGYTITLTELTPEKPSGEDIPDSSYRFVFTVERTEPV